MTHLTLKIDREPWKGFSILLLPPFPSSPPHPFALDKTRFLFVGVAQFEVHGFHLVQAWEFTSVSIPFFEIELMRCGWWLGWLLSSAGKVGLGCDEEGEGKKGVVWVAHESNHNLIMSSLTTSTSRFMGHPFFKNINTKSKNAKKKILRRVWYESGRLGMNREIYIINK